MRTHVGCRTTTDTQLQAQLEARIAKESGVSWCRFNGALGCLVIEHDPRVIDADSLALLVARAESGLGIDAPLGSDLHPERHPGDVAALWRSYAELGADLSSLVASGVLRRLGVKPLTIGVDAAALMELVNTVPPLRKAIERVTTIGYAEIGVEFINAAVQTLLESEMGPVTGTVHRALRLRELLARQRTWPEWEERLCGSPDKASAPIQREGERPTPLRKGPIEGYGDSTLLASLGGMAGIWLATRKPDVAVSTIFASAPSPALKGRDAFAAHLGWRLSQAGVLVLEPHALRKLDRIDVAVISRSTELDVIARSAQHAGLDLCLVDDDADALSAIRRYQARGLGVCYLSSGAGEAYAAADVSMGLIGASGEVPWGADLVCREPHQAKSLLQAVGAAANNSKRGVRLSQAEALAGLAMALGGLDAKMTRRIMMATSVSSLVAIGLGLRAAHGIELDASQPATTPATPWHSMSADEVLEACQSSRGGLKSSVARGRYVEPPAAPSAWRELVDMVGEELRNPMAPVLLIGSGLSAASGATADAALILSLLGFNGAIGGLQRYRTQRALRHLYCAEQPGVPTRRDGRLAKLPAGELVRGDVIELAAGDVVPADCRILTASQLEVDESSLTGESLPVGKSSAPTDALVVADRHSMLYAGTAIAAGSVAAVVVQIGEETEAQQAIAGTDAPSGGVEARLEDLTAMTTPMAAASGLVMAAAGLMRGRKVSEVMEAGVGLAVAAVPEGLPLLATMAQLSAAHRLSERGALVRNPRAVEALGRVDIICADKTGTLTEGKIRLAAVSDGTRATPLDQITDAQRSVVAVALRASPSTGKGENVAHPTDLALIEGARAMGIGSHDDFSGWNRLDQLPFEPRRGYHAGLAVHEGGRLISIKGAPEQILPRCSRWYRGRRDNSLDESRRQTLSEHALQLASSGYRVLAVAERSADHDTPVDEKRLHDLEFCGFLCFADPVRPTARAALEKLKTAGIEAIMLTGDHPSTARAIASQVGLDDRRRVITGPELDALRDDELDAAISEVSVFARVTPAQKVRIVKALQRCGRVVAMTGDGANDAPAIRLADVGIALGQRSTEAARAAADMVVTDERIETIVNAVLEGRTLWISVRDAVAMLVGGNIGEILYTVIVGLLSGGSPLNARQLLLINLLTDAAPSLAIALRPPRERSPEELMAEGPDASLGSALNRELAIRAAITTASASGAWLAARLTGSSKRASTVGMMALTGTQLAQTLVVGGRSLPVALSSIGSFALLVGTVQTPIVSRFFGSRPLGPLGLAQAGSAIAAGAAASAGVRGYQAWRNRRKRPS